MLIFIVLLVIMACAIIITRHVMQLNSNIVQLAKIMVTLNNNVSDWRKAQQTHVEYDKEAGHYNLR